MLDACQQLPPEMVASLANSLTADAMHHPARQDSFNHCPEQVNVEGIVFKIAQTPFCSGYR